MQIRKDNDLLRTIRALENRSRLKMLFIKIYRRSTRY